MDFVNFQLSCPQICYVKSQFKLSINTTFISPSSSPTPQPPPPPPDIQIENINLIYNVPINLLVSDVNDTFW
jgi:hypothetical protein